MWKVVTMCNLGEIWRYETEDASSALRAKNGFLATVRQHAGWNIDENAAAIVFTELVTNVVCHAPGPVRVTLECVGQGILLTVADNGPGFEFAPKLPADGCSENGRGLFVVSRYATDIGVSRSAAGGNKIVAKLRRQAA